MIQEANKWMLATAGSCLFGLFGVLRPPRQILVVHSHPSGKMHMLKVCTPSRDISASINA
jgi:hypothetical protein